MTTLAGRKIRRYRTDQSPKISREALGQRFGVSFSTVQGWEEDGKVPRPSTLQRVVQSGIVKHSDWFTPAECPRCERPSDSKAACDVSDCPLAVPDSEAA